MVVILSLLLVVFTACGIVWVVHVLSHTWPLARPWETALFAALCLGAWFWIVIELGWGPGLADVWPGLCRP